MTLAAYTAAHPIASMSNIAVFNLLTLTARNGTPADVCSCCLHPMKVGEWIELAPYCRHKMHTLCAIKWAIAKQYQPTQPNCPMCRSLIPVCPTHATSDEMVKLAGGFWMGGRLFANEELSHIDPPPPVAKYEVHLVYRDGEPLVNVTLSSDIDAARRCMFAMLYHDYFRCSPPAQGMPAPCLRTPSPRRFLVAMLMDVLRIFAVRDAVTAISAM